MALNTPIRTLPQTLRGEMAALLALGGPMALTQIVQFSIYTIDTIMIGRVGTDALAAAAPGDTQESSAGGNELLKTQQTGQEPETSSKQPRSGAKFRSARR